jgi:hypothetical protein
VDPRLKGVEPSTDTTLREVKKLIAERGRDIADQKEIAETVIELQNRRVWACTIRAASSHSARPLSPRVP